MRSRLYAFILLFAIGVCTLIQPAEATIITLREDSLRSDVDGKEYTGIPFNVSPGLVGLCDVPGCGMTGLGVSDSIHFFVSQGHTTFFSFCSEKEPSGGDHGDSCDPITGLFDVTLNEQGVEDLIEVTPYNPTFGQPGYGLDADGMPLQYLLVSDTGGQFPEPGTVVLVGFGVAGLAVARRRNAAASIRN